MAVKLRYKGPISPAQVALPGGGLLKVVSGGVYEIASENEANRIVASDPGWWEGAEGFTPTEPPANPSVASIYGWATHPYDSKTLYPSGIFCIEGGVEYISRKPTLGETPATSPEAWEQVALSSLPSSVASRSQLSNLITSKGSRCLISCATYSATIAAEGILALIGENFDGWTPERELKMGFTYPGSTAPSAANINAFLSSYNQIGPGKRTRGHCLIWHESLAAWAEKLTGLTEAEVEAIVKRYITQVVEAVGNRVDCWDVLNEVISDAGTGLRKTVWTEAFGGNLTISKTNPVCIFYANCFKWAREANPNVTLFVNEYNVETAAAYEAGGKGARLEAFVKVLQELGAPVEGVGLESHLNTKSNVTSSALQTIIKKWRELGVTVEITELTCVIEPGDSYITQNKIFKAVVQGALKGGVSRITVWGTTDRYATAYNEAWETEHGEAVSETKGPMPVAFDWTSKGKPGWYQLAKTKINGASVPSTVPVNTAILDVCRDFGASPGRDCTKALQEAIEQIMSVGTGEAHFSEPGIYLIEGSQIASETVEAFSNSGQILIPPNVTSNGRKTIKITGVTTTPKPQLGSGTEPSASAHGVILKSTATSGAVFAVAPAYAGPAGAGGPFSDVLLSFADLALQLPNEPKAWGIDARAATRARMRDMSVEPSPGLVGANVLPPEGTFGIALPWLENAGSHVLENVAIYGFEAALGLSEHVTLIDVFLGLCKYGIELYGTGHLNHFINLSIEECVTPFRTRTKAESEAAKVVGSGQGGAYIVGSVAFENVTTGAFGPGPFILDSENRLHGSLDIEGAPHGLAITGGLNVDLASLTRAKAGYKNQYPYDDFRRTPAVANNIGTCGVSMHPYQLLSGKFNIAGEGTSVKAAEVVDSLAVVPYNRRNGNGTRRIIGAVTVGTSGTSNLGVVINRVIAGAKKGNYLYVRWREGKMQLRLEPAGTVLAEAVVAASKTYEYLIEVTCNVFGEVTKVEIYLGKTKELEYSLTEANRLELADTQTTEAQDGLRINKETESSFVPNAAGVGFQVIPS